MRERSHRSHDLGHLVEPGERTLPRHEDPVAQVIEIREVLTPNDFPDLDTLQHRLLAFGRRYEQIAAPFEWKFTRDDLNRLLARADNPATALAA
jgi:hypothetical protein